jgi:GNAT superfamily N-acetyltransferase
MNLVSVENENIHLLKTFIENMGEASKSFRYFNKRSIDVIINHLVTILLLENEFPVAYGHLDREKNTVWLGVCVLPAFSGNGYGKMIMDKLIATAKKMQIVEISLTVDKDNKKAMNLYKKYDFKQEKEFDDSFRYILNIR